MAHNDDTAKGTINITVQMERQRMRDILTTAYEQGIGYWANDDDFESVDAVRDEKGYVKMIVVKRAKGARIPVFTGATQDLLDKRQARVYDTCLADAIGRAVGHKDAGHAAMCELAERDFDANTADVLVQFALFGEVVYG